MGQEYFNEDDHAEMVEQWIAECEAKGLDPATGSPLQNSRSDVQGELIDIWRAEY